MPRNVFLFFVLCFHNLPLLTIVVSVTSACGSLASKITSVRKQNNNKRGVKETGCGVLGRLFLVFGYDFHNVTS